MIAKVSTHLDRRQAPDTLHRGRSKLEHLAWIKTTGLPNAQAEVKAMQEATKACKEEIELLDMQMHAIAAMHGTQAYESACRRHLDAKILIDARLATASKKLRSAEQNARQMEITASSTSKETKKNRQARADIRQHDYYKGDGPPATAKGNKIGYANPPSTKIMLFIFCLLYTSPSPRD